MRTDIDYLINLMEKYTTKTVSELGEQDSESSTGGGSKNNVTTWAGTVGASLNRSGPANQIGNTKWSDIVKVNRGPANQLT